MAKYASKGGTLTIDGVVITQVDTIGPTSGGDAEKIDVTSHDSPNSRRQFLSGFKGEETFEFSLLYDPALAAHAGLDVLYDSGEAVPVIVGLPTTPADTFNFDGFVSSAPVPVLGVDGALRRSYTMTLTTDVVAPTVGP